MTGKEIFPIAKENGNYRVTIASERQVVSADQVGDIENQIRRKGYYPLHVTPARLQELDEDADKRKETFQQIMLDGVRRWMNMAGGKLRGSGARVFRCPGGGERALGPVGSTAVRQLIDKHQPLLSLHGHIHESKGAVKLGKTLSINPGSAYEEGILMAAVINLDAKKGIKSYQLVNG